MESCGGTNSKMKRVEMEAEVNDTEENSEAAVTPLEVMTFLQLSCYKTFGLIAGKMMLHCPCLAMYYYGPHYV